MTKSDDNSDDNFVAANKEANAAFGKLGEAITAATKGAASVDVVEVARRAGLDLDERVLAELQITRIIPCHPFIPWHVWFPWRPLWCWWWHFHYPWYRCCPYWWYRCHWYAH